MTDYMDSVSHIGDPPPGAKLVGEKVRDLQMMSEVDRLWCMIPDSAPVLLGELVHRTFDEHLHFPRTLADIAVDWNGVRAAYPELFGEPSRLRRAIDGLRAFSRSS